MVTKDADNRTYPTYALEQIQRLAGTRDVGYGTRKAQVDAQNLSYTIEDICECLQALSTNHFHHSEKYPGFPIWHDVYLISYSGPSGCIDELYVKLKLSKDCVLVTLTSFHLQQ